MQITILTKDSKGEFEAKIMTNDELEEHQEYVNDFEQEIKKCKLGFLKATTEVAIFISQPETAKNK